MFLFLKLIIKGKSQILYFGRSAYSTLSLFTFNRRTFSIYFVTGFHYSCRSFFTSDKNNTVICISYKSKSPTFKFPNPVHLTVYLQEAARYFLLVGVPISVSSICSPTMTPLARNFRISESVFPSLISLFRIDIILSCSTVSKNFSKSISTTQLYPSHSCIQLL